MPRLLALADGEVVGTLTRLPDEWRIAVARSLDEALAWGPTGQDVTLVGLGTVDASVRAAEKLRDVMGEVPCLVVAEAGDDTAGFPSIARGAVGSHLGALLAVLAHGGAEEPTMDGTSSPPPVVTSARRPPTPAPVAGVALLRRLRGRVLPIGEGTDGDRADDRIGRALVALGELSSLVADLPALRTVGDVVAALVDELEEVFAPDALAVWLEAGDGHYAVAGSRGLTSAERRMRVAPTHPVFSDLLMNVDGVLITPIDEAGSLVAGLGGARGTSLMAASVGIREEAIAVVTLSRDVEYHRSHLAQLERIADEAAPGIALARGLERLGVLGGELSEPAPEGPGEKWREPQREGSHG